VQTRELMQQELLALWEQNKAAVLFVTHDLDEAILLADRVAVLTSRPARVKSVYKIDLPRPRVVGELRYDQRFIRIAQQLHEDLKEEVMKAREVIPA
jgi:NitT/TauT family transport system ATP-binding protein